MQAIEAAEAAGGVFELEHRVMLKDGGIGRVFSRAILIFSAAMGALWR